MLTFNFHLAHCTRVSRLEDTKQLTPNPLAEFPPGCWVKREAIFLGDANVHTKQRSRALQGGQWHLEDRELVGELLVQRVGQANGRHEQVKARCRILQGKS